MIPPERALAVPARPNRVILFISLALLPVQIEQVLGPCQAVREAATMATLAFRCLHQELEHAAGRLPYAWERDA